ncbi:fas-associated death domain protein [Musca vetustissima]|uniref:fas-associated death domain protein n=1 Tax=Musca vetustissima TaxID=27455 RepID=UPI002AB710BB|nr:fas-associated death domain protein [Musca vetustissima]
MAQHWSYDILKHIAINDKNAQDNLEDLKSILQEDIGSARNMCRIKNMADLIDCLERHDALSEYNIEPLREIADQFENKELEEAVANYFPPKDSVAYTEPYNQYKEQRLADEVQNRLNINDETQATSRQVYNGQQWQNPSPGRPPIPNGFGQGQQWPNPPPSRPPAPSVYPQELTDKKRAAIHKLVANDIGKFWRALGRALELSQGQMDAIEMEYPRDLVSRVHKMLQVFEEDECHDPRQNVLLLCRALESCRRKDLRRKVEDIMSH